MERESMTFDVIIVGAGPAGLASAIRLAQLSKQHERPLSICVLEKAAEVGRHILSGAVLEPTALNELLPDWQSLNPPTHTPVSRDQFLYLSQQKAWSLPVPKMMNNQGNFIISLGQFCRWLASIAESLGVQIFPGFTAKEVLLNEQGHVRGVLTGDMGLDAKGNPKPHYQPGYELLASQTFFSEGCRGSLSEWLIKHFKLREPTNPQTYALGLKELWEIPTEKHQAGLVVHTVGWPLPRDTYGGTFLYHFDKNLIALGMAIGLDYPNPYLNPYEELQQFKHHPYLRNLLQGGQRLEYGARSLNEGGIQAIPKLTFPGGLLMGCSAGFLNVPKIKGTHTAMKSGMLAAETLFEALKPESMAIELKSYQQVIQSSWIWKELTRVRNIRPYFQKGLWRGLCFSAIDQYLFFGKTPWTLKHHLDHTQLVPAKGAKPIEYPKHDNQVSFDKLHSVSLSGTNHEEDQPCHLVLKDIEVPIRVNLEQYAAPETRYCPAGVYEVIQNEGKAPYLQINAQNCLHCKACDIKDPTQNITWTTPEAGGGPNYSSL